MPASLPPEVLQRHQQGRGEQIRLGFDVAFCAVTRLNVSVATREPIVTVAVQEVVAELVCNREAPAYLEQ